MRTQTLDDRTEATSPGGIRLSHDKMRKFHPELYQKTWLNRILNKLTADQQFWHIRNEEHLLHGDSRAAVVVSLAPLLVAAYTDEIDCIALLRFSEDLIKEYNLKVGTRLLTINLYGGSATDLEPGPAACNRWFNFSPYIADFLSDDRDRIQLRKTAIDDKEWARTEELACAYVKNNPGKYRDGRPLCSFISAK